MSHYQTISSIEGRGMDGVQTKMGLTDQYFLSIPICLILYKLTFEADQRYTFCRKIAKVLSYACFCFIPNYMQVILYLQLR